MREQSIAVSFVIDWNKDTGRVKANTMKAVARHLLSIGAVKGQGAEFSITDSAGAFTGWTLARGGAYCSAFKWVLSIEFTEDETAKGVDFCNCLFFDNRGQKIIESEFEAYRV